MFSKVIEEGFSMKKISLNNGIKIPALGMGGWSQSKKEILAALEIGYRLLDTAAQYGNEEEFGAALSECNIPRNEIFLTTKLWTEDIRLRRVREAFFESLERLKTDYIDLYLIHWPAEGYEDAWLIMEELLNEKKIRAIGVSNFEDFHLKSLKNHGGTIVPAVNQIEIHPYFSNSHVSRYCSTLGITLEAWCPLGGPLNMEARDPVIVDISKKYHKTPQQIILRWHYQQGTVTIPKTSNPTRMKDNLNIFDFKLNSDDMTLINSIDKNMRLGANPNNFDF